MQDYRLDAIERPERHAAAVDRLTGCSRQSSVDYSGGELPGQGRWAPIAVGRGQGQVTGGPA
jgi:hypothetical protein